MDTPYLTWQDVAAQFSCGRTKAQRIIHQVGPVYIGRTPLLPKQKLEDYLAANNGEIRIDWRY